MKKFLQRWLGVRTTTEIKKEIEILAHKKATEFFEAYKESIAKKDLLEVCNEILEDTYKGIVDAKADIHSYHIARPRARDRETLMKYFVDILDSNQEEVTSKILEGRFTSLTRDLKADIEDHRKLMESDAFILRVIEEINKRQLVGGKA